MICYVVYCMAFSLPLVSRREWWSTFLNTSLPTNMKMRAMEYVSFILVGLHFSVWVAWDWASSKYIIRLWCFCYSKVQRCMASNVGQLRGKHDRDLGCIGFFLLWLTNFGLHNLWTSMVVGIGLTHMLHSRGHIVLNCEPNMKLQGMWVMFYNSKRINKQGERGGNEEASKQVRWILK